ncbi:MAG: late competence development ComFB family protein [Pseudomonadota bacterium]
MFSSVSNYYERMVFEQIPLILAELGEDLDENFMEDLACIALNRLPPRYVRHSVDLAFSLNDLEWEELKAQVTQAIHEAFRFARRRRDAR